MGWKGEEKLNNFFLPFCDGNIDHHGLAYEILLLLGGSVFIDKSNKERPSNISKYLHIFVRTF